MMKDSRRIHHTENTVFWWFAIMLRTGLAIVAKVNDVSKVQQIGRGKEVTIPYFNVVIWGVGMCCEGACFAKKRCAKTIKTTIRIGILACVTLT
jgi:hypothetical protein